MPPTPTDVSPRSRGSSGGEEEIPRGALIDRYVVVGVLGRGGMGTVYRAYDAQIDRTVAIKILRADVARDDAGSRIGVRMRREAQAMARLRHPNVVVVHDVGAFEGRVFLAMEFVDGETLKEWTKGDHSLAQRMAVLLAAGRGLAAAHAAGLIHRDFKPDNVLVGKDGRVLVTDFGIARLAGEGEEDPSNPSRSVPSPVAATSSDAPTDPSASPSWRPSPEKTPVASIPPEATLPAILSLTEPLTMTGSILGTVGFMPPEQAFGESANAASDQFSFCATAYVTLYGSRPFPGNDVSTYLASLEKPPRPPPPGTTVPAWIHRILVRGLAHDPADRFPSMDTLLAALEADPAIARRKRRTAAAVVGGVLVAVAAVAVATPRHHDACAPDPKDLVGIWDDDARADVTGAFQRSGAPDGAEVAARVAKVLDETAARWTAMKTESCEATRVTKRQTEEEFRLRADCLDRRRGELHAMVSSLRGTGTVDKGVVEKGVAAVYGLTNVAVCADVPMLRRSGGLPDDATARAKVLESRAELARATSLQLVGRLAESTSEAEKALATARASGHASTVAEALHVLGALEVEQNEYGKAEPFLTDSTWTAARAGADSLVVRTASLTAFVVGAKLGRIGEARIWVGVAEAAVDRVGASQELELELEEHKAWLAADSDGRPEDTIPMEERIVRAYDQLYGVHPHTLRALYNLGDSLTAAGNHARACEMYTRAIAMGETIGGPNYAWVGFSLEGLGDCLTAQGEFAKGDRALDRAVGIFVATSDEYSQCEVLDVVIRSALAQGDQPRAIAGARKALALMKGLEGTASLVPIVNVPIAEALLGDDSAADAREAEALCTEALRKQEELGQVDPAKTLRADALRCLGDALIHEGQAREAIAPLERSVAIPRRTYPGDLARARFSLARAIVASHGDAGRARSLAEEARTELSAAPGLRAERDEVDRWLALATRPPRAGAGETH